MANPSDPIRSRRPDLSPYLFNFLRDKNADEVLHTILDSGTLKSPNNNFICFTDAPITCYLQDLEYFDEWKKRGRNAMFTKFGIGISRDWLIENRGALPVIYGPEGSENLLDVSIQWRFQPFDLLRNEFSWLREWRIPMKELNLREIPKGHIIIVVPTTAQLKEYAADIDFDIDFEVDHGESYPYMVETAVREWKGFSIEQISEIDNDFALSGATATQTIGEEM